LRAAAGECHRLQLLGESELCACEVREVDDHQHVLHLRVGRVRVGVRVRVRVRERAGARERARARAGARARARARVSQHLRVEHLVELHGRHARRRGDDVLQQPKDGRVGRAHARLVR